MYKCLKLSGIGKTYQDEHGETEALRNFNYSFLQGHFTSIVGPSGCGKSTLLSIIGLLEKPTTGEVFLDNSILTRKNCNIGYMLQKDYLLEWRSVYQNVLFGLEVRKNLTNETKAYAESLLLKYDLMDFKDKYPDALSGGMRQRVALIRTLATNPDVLLLDEAFSALDYQTRLSVTEDVYRIIKEENKITIMVTHDIPEAISMSDEIIVLTKRPATIKNVHTISFDMENRTPLNCRDNPMFSKYFERIWKELGNGK